MGAKAKQGMCAHNKCVNAKMHEWDTNQCVGVAKSQLLVLVVIKQHSSYTLTILIKSALFVIVQGEIGNISINLSFLIS